MISHHAGQSVQTRFDIIFMFASPAFLISQLTKLFLEARKSKSKRMKNSMDAGCGGFSRYRPSIWNVLNILMAQCRIPD